MFPLIFSKKNCSSNSQTPYSNCGPSVLAVTVRPTVPLFCLSLPSLYPLHLNHLFFHALLSKLCVEKVKKCIFETFSLLHHGQFSAATYRIWAVVVAQLVERSLSTLEIRGLNPVSVIF